MTTYKEENFSKEVEEETVTENGRTKKIIRTKVKRPDGSYEETVEEK